MISIDSPLLWGKHSKPGRTRARHVWRSWASQKNSQFVIVLHVTMWPSAMIIYQRVVQLHVGYNMIQLIVKPKKKNQTESGTCFQDGINDVYHM